MIALLACLLAPAPVTPIGPPDWSAKWIWGSVHEDGGLGYFRRRFELAGDADRFVAQTSGDDGYELFLDGKPVANGGFWWNTTNVHELGPLTKGRHVLAARVANAARPGGLLVEAWAVGEGLRECIATDASWRFAGEAPDTFADLGFDDAGWEQAREIGPPPVGPWGELPLRYVGPVLGLELMEVAMTVKGRAVSIAADVRVTAPQPEPRLIGLDLVRDGHSFARAIVPSETTTDTWQVGDRIQLTGAIEVGPFVPAGEYTVCFGPYGTAYGEDETMAVGTVTLAARDADYPRTEVKPHNGAPALFVDGEPVFPLMLMSCTIDQSDIADAASDGIHLETIAAASGWAGDGKYEYSDTDRAIQKTLEADPESLILLRIDMNAPGSWLEAHPEELVEYADPASWEQMGMSGPKHASFASRLWRDDACEALRRLVRHIRESGWADHILGYHITAGIYGEWHYWNSPWYPDTGKAFERAYGEWLRAEYPDDPPAPRIPTLEERRLADVGMFRDPVASRWLIDYQRFFHQQGAEALSELARTVKDESRGRCLTLAFNGYLPDLDWNLEGDHRRFDMVLREPAMDGFASPHSYVRRGLGQDAILRGFPESARAMGKLWWDEEDDRTSLANDPTFTHVRTIPESVEVLWRGFARMLTHASGGWYMDQQGGWYRDPAIHEAFARMKVAGDASMERSRERQSDVAVIASFRNAWYLADRSSGLDKVTNALINPQLEQLTKCGTPFDLYLIDEAFEPTVSDYKAYVFLDTFYMSDDQLAAARALIERGKTVLFFYAPGYISDEALSLGRLRQLTGQPVEQTDSMALASGETQKPGFGVPGLAGPVARAGNVWYCPAPPLPAASLREILSGAGAHVWLDSEDPLMAGCGYVGFHAASDGEKVLHAPGPVTWIDVRTGTTLATGTDTLTVSARLGETVLLQVD